MKTTTPCPFCGKTLTRIDSRLTLDVTPGDYPAFSMNWKVKHDDPLCFEWQAGRVTADELLGAFSDDG